MYYDLSQIVSLLNVLIEINTTIMAFSFFACVVSLFNLFRIRKERAL